MTDMKRFFLLLFVAITSILTMAACSKDSPDALDNGVSPGNTTSGSSANYFGGKKVLIAYFSWGGTTKRMAQEIQRITGGDIFEIEPATPYPTNYTQCTQVALQERENDERPAIKNKVENINEYDVVFIGCPVWWHTAPMIISTFAESYDLSGKTIVPFCTYASTYRDETLQKIVDLTSSSKHLQGLGTTGSTSGVQTWIDLINEQWNNDNADNATDATGDATNPNVSGFAPMSGKVNLWFQGRIPSTTQNANNSDGPDFIPNMEVFTVGENVTPKGAVVICPGGAFAFRSVQNEGYDVANMLNALGYQCFVVNYRIQPYSMQESALDLQRAIRYVRAHAADYRINERNIALVGFSAGGILNGEVLLNWRDLKNASALVSSYQPDELDQIPVSACAVGMIYSFYGRLSVSMNNVATLRAANLPPAFYCWGTRDGFAGQFTQNSNAVKEAGCRVETRVLQNYPHGYGAAGNTSVWGDAFDEFLMSVIQGNTTGIKSTEANANNQPTIYSLNGKKISSNDSVKGTYIVKTSSGSRKVMR